jgi:diguanylate cyclase (GGDEF)-like protein
VFHTLRQSDALPDVPPLPFAGSTHASPEPSGKPQDLANQNAVLKDAFEHFPAGVAIYDAGLRLVLCNDVLKKMLDYPESLFAFGMPSLEQIFRFNAERGEYGDGRTEDFVASRLELARKRESHVYERRRPNGATLEVRGVPLESGGFVTIYLDVSGQRTRESTPEAWQLGEVDRLTGLPTRKQMERQLANILRTLLPVEVACLHCLDMDDFATVNANYGRVVGDYVLKEVAIRLSAAVRGTDFVGRIGGDRFLILQTNIRRPSESTRLARRMIEEIRRPIHCGQADLSLSASVGFTMVNGENDDIEGLIKRASESVVAVKHSRRSTIEPAAE